MQGVLQRQHPVDMGLPSEKLETTNEHAGQIPLNNMIGADDYIISALFTFAALPSY
jgi:hypothetical protein